MKMIKAEQALARQPDLPASTETFSLTPCEGLRENWRHHPLCLGPGGSDSGGPPSGYWEASPWMGSSSLMPRCFPGSSQNCSKDLHAHQPLGKCSWPEDLSCTVMASPTALSLRPAWGPQPAHGAALRVSPGKGLEKCDITFNR